MAKEYKKYLVRQIDLEKAKHYKKKELEFDYLPKKVFDKMEKEQDVTFTVVGSIKLKTTNKTKTDTVSIHSNDRFFNYELIDIPEDPTDKDKREHDRDVMGYLLVGEDTYVSLIKSNLLLIILLFGLIGIGLIGAGVGIGTGKIPTGNNPTEDTQNSLEFEDGDDWDGENPQDRPNNNVQQESIKIPGYANLYVSSENPNIRLINPEGNTVYMTYTIKNGDEVIYETKAIKPDQMVSVNFKELLPVGEHELTFIIATFDVETQAGCNGATQSVNILVKE